MTTHTGSHTNVVILFQSPTRNSQGAAIGARSVCGAHRCSLCGNLPQMHAGGRYPQPPNLGLGTKGAYCPIRKKQVRHHGGTGAVRSKSSHPQGMAALYSSLLGRWAIRPNRMKPGAYSVSCQNLSFRVLEPLVRVTLSPFSSRVYCQVPSKNL